MVKALVVLALFAVPASAANTITLHMGAGCPDSTVSFSGGSSQCAPGAGVRWMGGQSGAVWKVGLGVDHWRYGEPERYFNGRGGSATLGQVLIQHDFSEGYARPYVQLGAGVLNSSAHTGGHPADLAGSGALGFETGERFVFGLEARAVYAKLDGERFGGQGAIIFAPSVRLGWRFK